MFTIKGLFEIEQVIELTSKIKKIKKKREYWSNFALEEVDEVGSMLSMGQICKLNNGAPCECTL